MSRNRLKHNGPAIWGGCVTRRKHRGIVLVPRLRRGQKTVTAQGGYGACFCSHGTNFIECWRDRVTSLIGAVNLSPVTNLVVGTGAVSRYNLSRSQKIITVQDFNCVLMRALPNVAQRSWVSGCKSHYKFVLGAGAKAKTVTSNLPILSVLGNRAIFQSIYFYTNFYFERLFRFLIPANNHRLGC